MILHYIVGLSPEDIQKKIKDLKDKITKIEGIKKKLEAVKKENFHSFLPNKDEKRCSYFIMYVVTGKFFFVKVHF